MLLLLRHVVIESKGLVHRVVVHASVFSWSYEMRWERPSFPRIDSGMGLEGNGPFASFLE